MCVGVPCVDTHTSTSAYRMHLRLRRYAVRALTCVPALARVCAALLSRAHPALPAERRSHSTPHQRARGARGGCGAAVGGEGASRPGGGERLSSVCLSVSRSLSLSSALSSYLSLPLALFLSLAWVQPLSLSAGLCGVWGMLYCGCVGWRAYGTARRCIQYADTRHEP